MSLVGVTCDGPPCMERPCSRGNKQPTIRRIEGDWQADRATANSCEVIRFGTNSSKQETCYNSVEWHTALHFSSMRLKLHTVLWLSAVSTYEALKDSQCWWKSEVASMTRKVYLNSLRSDLIHGPKRPSQSTYRGPSHHASRPDKAEA